MLRIEEDQQLKRIALLIIFIIMGLIVIPTYSKSESSITDYWNIEFDEEYFNITYVNLMDEFTEYDILKVTLVIHPPDNVNNYRLSFNGEISDLTGYIVLTKHFEITIMEYRLWNVNTYPEAIIKIQQWNETKLNYFTLGQASILKAEVIQSEATILGFEFFSIILLVSLIITKKKVSKW